MMSVGSLGEPSQWECPAGVGGMGLDGTRRSAVPNCFLYFFRRVSMYDEGDEEEHLF